jgi:hypothetical protein
MKRSSLMLPPGNIPGGWAAVKDELALKYQEGGYPEMAAMIKV